jgi:hypothetical protein
VKKKASERLKASSRTAKRFSLKTKFKKWYTKCKILHVILWSFQTTFLLLSWNILAFKKDSNITR